VQLGMSWQPSRGLHLPLPLLHLLHVLLTLLLL
jgi:hypothetical protein